MASTQGLVPITRAFLASYYDRYPFPPLSEDVSLLSSEIRSLATHLQNHSPPTQGESLLINEADRPIAHKIDENMWKNREHIEQILFLLERSHWPPSLQQQSTSEDAEFASFFEHLKAKFEKTLKALESFHAENSESVFTTVMTYMPQDFRGTLIRQQKERSERNKKAEVDTLIDSGGTIQDRYALLWKQQMERRTQLAQLGSATGMYKTLVKYLVGVPQVLLDFIRQINDDHGPMEEQRQRYGPPLYCLTAMVLSIRLFLFLSWGRFEARKLTRHEIAVLEKATDVYTTELERFIKFISVVFENSPFLISAEDAGATEARKFDDFKEICIPAGKTHEVLLLVEAINSYIAWDFSLVKGKMNTVLFESFFRCLLDHFTFYRFLKCNTLKQCLINFHLCGNIPVEPGRTKYIGTYRHFIKEKLREGLIFMSCSLASRPAGVLTKGFNGRSFHEIISMLGMEDIFNSLRGSVGIHGLD